MNSFEPLAYKEIHEWMGNHSTSYTGYSNYVIQMYSTTVCPYCGRELRCVFSEVGDAIWEKDYYWSMDACLSCLWWKTRDHPNHYFNGWCHTGGLHRSVITGIEPQLESAIQEIKADLNRLYKMNPKRFEEFVGKILKEHINCDVEHVGRSHDGGIDLILMNSDTGHIPVQVKRRTHSSKTESVSLVREFRGAMLLKGYNHGMLVTTADHFSSEAVKASTPKDIHLVPQTVELIDCRRLLDIMDIIMDQSLCIDIFKKAFGMPTSKENLKKIEDWFKFVIDEK